MTFTLVPITRTYLDDSGQPRGGTVRLQLVGVMSNGGQIADRKPVIATLDGQGKISTQFYATNDPDTLPAGGGTVEVTETLSGVATATYFIAVPYDGGPLDLETAPHLGEAILPGVFFQPVNEKGLPNGYAGLDGSGRVSYDLLPADIGSGGGGGGGGGTTPISGDDTDIRALGTRAAGASGKAADAQHVHAMPSLHEVRKPTQAIDLNGQRVTHAANGVDPTDLATVAQLGQSVLGWYNVKDAQYGAKGDGTTDDRAAIQAAMDACPAGGIVYFPQGVYRVSATLKPKPGTVLQGTHSSLMSGAGLTDPACYIQPLASFTGTALITLQDQTSGGYASLPAEHRINDLMLDGSTLDGTKPVDGIYAAGNIQNVVMRNVTIRKMSNNGIVTAGVSNVFPYSWRLHSVMIDNCRASGALLTRLTDLTMIDVQAIGNWATGFKLSNIANSTLVACRSEWNGNHGFWLTGAWGNGAGSGGAIASACSTDRNGWHGVLVDATGSGPITLADLATRRDGRNGGSGGGNYAGLSVTAATVPVVVDGITCYPGVDDDGTGISSPQFGVYLTGASQVQVGSGYLHAFEDGLRDATVGGSVAVGAEVTTLSGSTTTTATRQRRYTRETTYTVNQLLGSNPFYAAHRGSGMEFPEHTMVAYDSAIAAGVKAIEVSVNVTADGIPVCMHDVTLDRTTNTVGNVSDWTYAALKNKVRTNLQPLLGSGWVEQEIPTLRQVLDKYLGKVVIFLEAKSNATVAPVQKMIEESYPHAYRSLVWKGHYLNTTFAWAKNRNITTWAYLDAATTDAQMDAMVTAPDIWGVPHTMTNTRIAQVVTRGKPVICWEVHRRSDVTRLTGLGVQGLMCAQLLYVRGTAPLSSTVDWATSVKAPGDMGLATYSTTRAFVYDGDGGATFGIVGSSGLVGSRSMLTYPTNGYRIAFDMKFDGVPPTAEHAGIAFGKLSDDVYQFGAANVSGGYHIALRGSGDMQLFTHTAGVTSGTQLQTTVNTAAPVAGQWMSFQVDVTPTQVIVRRTDGTTSTITSGNTDYRGTYVHLSMGSISSLANKPHWRNLTITAL